MKWLKWDSIQTVVRDIAIQACPVSCKILQGDTRVVLTQSIFERSTGRASNLEDNGAYLKNLQLRLDIGGSGWQDCLVARPPRLEPGENAARRMSKCYMLILLTP